MESKAKGYDGLALSSGGYKGIAMLGALSLFEERGYLKNVKRYSGTSVGAVISLLMACGWSPTEIFKRAVKIKIFNSISDFDPEKFKESYGVLENTRLKEIFESMILEKRKTLPTLLDLHNEGIYLSFETCDRRTKTGVRLDYRRFPNLLAHEAVLMSSNIPFVFSPIDFAGCRMVDGALTNPFPIDHIDPGDDSGRKILCISVFDTPSDDEKSFISYVTGTIMVQIEEAQRRSAKNASNSCDVLELFTKDMNVLDTNTPKDSKVEMFLKGIKDAKYMIRAVRERPNHFDMKPPKIKSMPKEVIFKCLVSQPISVLCFSAIKTPEKLKRCFNDLGEKSKRNIISLIECLSPEPKQIETSKTENHVQKIYDKMPIEMRGVAKVIYDSLPREDSRRMVGGVNRIFDGLKMMGLNMFGAKIQDPLVFDTRFVVLDESESVKRRNVRETKRIGDGSNDID